MGDFTEIFHRRIQRPVLHPGLGRALLAKALQETAGASGQVFGIAGFYLPDLREEIRQGIFERSVLEIIYYIRTLEQHAGQEIPISVYAN